MIALVLTFSWWHRKYDFVQWIKHFFAIGLEFFSKLVVNEDFKCFVDKCNCNLATRAYMASTCSSTISLVSAGTCYRLSNLCGYLKFRCRIPNQKDRIVCHEISCPFVWFQNYVQINTVLIVFLHVSIDKEVKTCEIWEWYVFRQRRSWLFF